MMDLNKTYYNESYNQSAPNLPVPRELRFTNDSLLSVVIYSIVFAVSATGNLSVFVILFRQTKSRVNLFIMNLCYSDLIVTFVMLPLEIGWHITVSWKAGDLGCRLLMFCRAYGFYLSSFILIAISLDRYLVVVHPLQFSDTGRRGKIMIVSAWVLSAVCCIPQSVIFHEETHPFYNWYKQCVTFHYFPTESHELAYNLFSATMLYFLPLVVIIFSYSLVLRELSKKKNSGDAGFSEDGKHREFSSSAYTCKHIHQARNRTLKMTIVIVIVFITCWTPYYTMYAWWWFDKTGAMKIDPKIQRGLFIFAVSNSCMNPVVYGMFTTVFQKEVSKLGNFLLSCCCKKETAQCQYHHRDRVGSDNNSQSLMLKERNAKFHYRTRVYNYRKSYNMYYCHQQQNQRQQYYGQRMIQTNYFYT